MTTATAITIYDVLDDLRSRDLGIRDKGTAFEDLVAKFLTSDPLYADQFDSVVPYAEFADEGKRRDLGIDLVAHRRDGGVVAIQCKFFAAHAKVEKRDVDTFLAESGKEPFTERLIVSTTDNWGPNAEAALQNQQIPVARIGLTELNDSRVEWLLVHELQRLESLELKPHKTPRPHQRAAIEDVKAGFAESARGKLVMACGTGKTFTSLKLVEEMVPTGGKVLFLAPSISLVSQSLREWGSEKTTPMQFFAVCSDASVGKRSTKAGADEDISAHDLVIPATTKGDRLAAGAAQAAATGETTVVFSTYQSIDVITEAQRQGLGSFDLIICDEAHRTTGAWADTGAESAFTKIHSDDNVQGAKRLYMTATPRVYGDGAKSKAAEGAITIASMDDETIFGPEFHRLEFGTAVDQDLLTDYKVIVLNIAEDYTSSKLQTMLADENSEIGLDDAAKLVGVWNALAKRSIAGDFGDDAEPMRRVVTFAKSIKDSKVVEQAFREVSKDLSAGTADVNLVCETLHVDGTQNALLRSEKLAWLKAATPNDSTCRVLTNARCLSEGVDVPALDAVVFLNPRNSIVDVVQSVGRVMRKDPAGVKQLGYVIIPVAVPAGMEPDQALDNHARYKVVWDVLRALRSHDSRLDAEINTLDPSKPNPRLRVINIGSGGGEGDSSDGDMTSPAEIQGTLDLADATAWREAVLARLVKHVGTRMYWDTWGKEVADIVERTTTRINTLLDTNAEAASEFAAFHEGLKGNLNDSIDRDQAIGMLAQHMVTAPVFEALLGSYDFIEKNAVAQVMERMLGVLYANNLATEYADLENFYASVRERVKGVDDAGRMRFVNELYEKFFKLAFPKVADQLGIVYTPIEVVDFILRSVDHLLREQFDSSLADPGVHILDPFTGTGTFIVRLIQSGLIDKDALLHKYTQEMHANEILLLAYYIAAINIEAAYHSVTGGHYEPFPGAVLADTFQMTEDGDVLDTKVFSANNDRMQQQLALPIRVIVGNPPYSVGQTSGNDNAANVKYPGLDARIENTYAKWSTATNKNSLYDSYIRAIRWASDRIDTRGIVGFVTNGGFIDANTADGLRKTLADEFTDIYIYNLRGNQRTAGEQSKKEGGKIFGSGSRNTVAVTFLVKNPNLSRERALVHYRDIGDYLTRDQKLETVNRAEIASLEWDEITPNESGDWTNQRTHDFEKWQPIGGDSDAVFRAHSRGLATARDAWVYNFSSAAVEANVTRMVNFYNSQVDDFATFIAANPTTDPRKAVDGFIDTDPARISWNRADKANVARGRGYRVNPSRLYAGAYRPFTKQFVHFQAELNDMVYRLPSMFPTPSHPNFGFSVTAPGGSASFATLASMHVPDLVSVAGAGNAVQFFARYTYESVSDGTLDLSDDVIDGYRRVDNITESTLKQYRAWYGESVSRDDVFAFVYGFLHSPDYRERYAADLKRSLPRIPRIEAENYVAFRDAGARLLDLHVNYEDAEPYALRVDGIPEGLDDDAMYDALRVSTQMSWGKNGKDKDRTVLHYSDTITISGIPEGAHRYMLGPRSALEWIRDRYWVKTDKASGIVNDPNDWSREVGNPRYIVDLIAKVTTVSVETMRIVDSLPPLRIVEHES